MVAGSPESVSPWPGLAGAEGANGVRKGSELGTVTGTRPQKSMNASLEDLELIF